jgi:NitT/TauT family transport system permease protein
MPSWPGWTPSTPADDRRSAPPASGRTWPKLLAIAIVVGVWQVVVWSGWRPEYVLPSPATVFKRFFQDLGEATTWEAIGNTMKRAATGYSMALVIGTLIGLAVTRFRALRAAIGSLITGIQTMPSIAWFPLAILLFRGTEGSIMFVVVIGAAPAIANGVIAGVDHLPPLWLRAGAPRRQEHALYRHRRSAWPAYLGPEAGSSGAQLRQAARVDVASQPGTMGAMRPFALITAGLMSVMLIVLILGILVDSLVFGTIDRRIRRRRGLAER